MLYRKIGTNVVVYAVKFDYEKWRQEGHKAYPMVHKDSRLLGQNMENIIRPFARLADGTLLNDGDYLVDKPGTDFYAVDPSELEDEYEVESTAPDSTLYTGNEVPSSPKEGDVWTNGLFIKYYKKGSWVYDDNSGNEHVPAPTKASNPLATDDPKSISKELLNSGEDIPNDKERLNYYLMSLLVQEYRQVANKLADLRATINDTSSVDTDMLELYNTLAKHENALLNQLVNFDTFEL